MRLSCAVLFVTLAWAAWFPQTARAQLNIENYGLRMPQQMSLPKFGPTGNTTVLMPRGNTTVQMAPGLTPDVGEGIDGTTARNPRVTANLPAPIYAPAPVQLRSIDDPIVAADGLGFFNAASERLVFYLIVDGSSREITLLPRQILTVTVNPAAQIKGTIGTQGGISTDTTFSAGQIYLLHSEAGRWAFAKL